MRRVKRAARGRRSSTNPPRVTNPWIKATLVQTLPATTAAAPYAVTPAKLAAYLTSQRGVTACEFKWLGVEIWAGKESAGTPGAVGLETLRTTGLGVGLPLWTGRDDGTSANVAQLHHVRPRQESFAPMSDSMTEKALVLANMYALTGAVVHYHVLWRPKVAMSSFHMDGGQEGDTIAITDWVKKALTLYDSARRVYLWGYRSPSEAPELILYATLSALATYWKGAVKNTHSSYAVTF